MYFGIYDEYTIRTLKTNGKKAILIRALEPSYFKTGIPYEIREINQYVAVLELYFQDISEYPHKGFEDRFVLFNEEMAEKLILFLNENDFDEVVTHCSAGVSRSSALMICVSRILGIPEIEEKVIKCGRFLPNPIVLKELSKFDFEPKYENYEHKTIHTNEEVWDEEEFDIELVRDEDGAYKIFGYTK